MNCKFCGKNVKTKILWFSMKLDVKKTLIEKILIDLQIIVKKI